MGEKKYGIYAGWDNNLPRIGILDIESIRGGETVSFTYDESWLSVHGSLVLDPDIMPYSGRQYPHDGKAMFGFLSDMCPDRWGRKLMERREIIDARLEKRTVRKLLDSDYLIGVHDEGRQGGIRIKDESSGSFVSDRKALAAPPMTELRKLEHSFSEYEKSRDPYEKKWLMNLLDPGSSLGGARPKANVTDTSGNIWIAKFPSGKDDRNIGAWEMVVHELACACGIHVPEARLMNLSETGSTFLVRRFDRCVEEGRLSRKHFASAMTMLGETDGSNSLISYLDIAAVIEELCAEPEDDLRQLWQRIVFSIAVSNTDDHLRNHGFLLSKDGWHLSPAYDLNPSYDQQYLSLAIDEFDTVKDLNLALSVCEYFRFTKTEALAEIRKMQFVIRSSWKKIAGRYKISSSEQALMSAAFSECDRDTLA